MTKRRRTNSTMTKRRTNSTMTKGRTNSTMTKRSRTKSIPLQKEEEQTIP
jgi:hypothetical protein